MDLDLGEVADLKKEEYQNASPFPHIVLDNIFNPYPLARAAHLFPSPSELKFFKYDNVFEKKLAFDAAHKLPYAIRSILYELNSSLFVRFLERLTGIKGIIPDPHYVGGGIHQIEAGGKLAIHTDFNWHGDLQLDRRLNVLVYLNRDWKPEYGGDLELWDKDMTKCHQKIAPIFNRMVIFNTTDFSPHGHPEPLTCPEGMTRKSIATYYYTNGRPEAEVSPKHRTIYKRRPHEAIDPEIEKLREARSKGRLKDETT